MTAASCVFGGFRCEAKTKCLKIGKCKRERTNSSLETDREMRITHYIKIEVRCLDVGRLGVESDGR